MSNQIKDPRKWARQLCEQHGGVKVRSDPTGETFEFPDRYRMHLPKTMHSGTVAGLASTLQKRYGRARETELRGLERAGMAPVLDISRLESTAHARQRLELMREQADVSYQEILLALRTPIRVRHSAAHGSWVWFGERIAVAAVVLPDGTARITTLLWADQDGFDANPRPQKGKRPSRPGLGALEERTWE